MVSTMINIFFPVSILCLLMLSGKVHGIIGGKQPLKSFPFQVGIFDIKSNTFKASGCILSKKFVLSGASPLYSFKTNNGIFIMRGDIHLTYNKTKQMLVEKLIFHELYNDKTKANNLVIIKLKNPIKFCRKIYAATLQTEEVPDGALVEIGGWGSQNYPAKHSIPAPFSVVEVPVVPIDICKKEYVQFAKNNVDDNICTSTKLGEGTCYGDAGGPVMYQKKVVGIISAEKPCANGISDSHTKIINYELWILKKCMSEI